MNKTALISIIVVIILIVLGVVVYSKSSPTAVVPENTTDTSMNHDEMTATTSDTTATSTTATSTGTSVGVGASVGVVTGTTRTFTVTGDNFKFSPATMTVKKGETVKIVFKNANGIHDFVIDEFKVATNKIQSGQEETVTFVANKAGSFEYYCSVGTHRQMGMKGTLTVTE